MARTFALITPLQPVLHRVYCRSETFPNAPEHYENLQNMSLGSHGMDSVDLLQKFLTQLCGLNFCINYNSSARFEASIVKQRNGPRWTQTLRNKTKHEFRVQWGGSGAFNAKNSDTTLWDELFHYLHQFSLFCTEFHAVTKWSKMQPNTMKTQQKMSLWSNGMDQMRSLRKHPTRLRGTNFCINCTSSAHFAPSLMQ